VCGARSRVHVWRGSGAAAEALRAIGDALDFSDEEHLPRPTPSATSGRMRWRGTTHSTGSPRYPASTPVEVERACHDEAWGCASSRVWRAYLEVTREAA